MSSAASYLRQPCRSLGAAAVLAAMLAGTPATAAESLSGAYEAEILAVSANGTMDAAVRTWFGQVTIAKVRARSVETVETARQCGSFVADGGPAIGPGKRVYLSRIRGAGGASGYVADIRHLAAAPAERSGLPVVLRGGKAAPCLPR